MICVLGVPNHMTYADFCQFYGSFIQYILELRTFRQLLQALQWKTILILRDGGLSSAFHCGRTIHLYTGSMEHAQASSASSTEQPSCPVCLGDNYVQRLIQSKTDGKLVELNSHCVHTNEGCGSCDCVEPTFNEALLDSKVEAIINEYNELLTTQHENQKFVISCFHG